MEDPPTENDDDASTPDEDQAPVPDAVDAVEPDAVATPPVKAGRRMTEWLIVAAVAIAVALLVRVFVVEQYRVDGASMLATLHNGDRVLVDKLSYRFHDPRHGDVVVLDLGAAIEHEDLIKRVVAVAGETVEVDGCTVMIDGHPIDEPYLDADLLASDGCGPAQPSLVVPAHSVFVMGDHRGGSKDSRSFGPVDDDQIVGRARVVLWPFGDWSWL